MGQKIKEWYILEYDFDLDAKEYLNEETTFEDLFIALDNYEDIYVLLGQWIDSIIRENIFSKLATLMQVDYDYIYEQWLKGEY